MTELSSANYLQALDLPAAGGKTKAIQEKARAALANLTLPGPKDENYKYTSFTEIIEGDFTYKKPSKIINIDQFKLQLDSYLLVLINGSYRPELSQLPTNATIRQISAKSAEAADLASLEQIETQVFSQLALATFDSAVSINISKNTKLDKPLYLLRLNPGEQSYAPSVVLVNLEQGAELQLVEHFTGETNSFSNSLVKIQQQPNSKLEHLLLQNRGLGSFQVSRVNAHLQAHSNYINHNLSFGAKLARNDINVTFEGESAYAELNGLVHLKNTQHLDNQTFIHHKVPHCESAEVYHNIVDESAQVVFNGKVLVAQDAQKTNADQLNKTLLLSDEANIFSKPQLEIYADDVKCTHGATIGRIDNDAYFYLRARGISPEHARSILVAAFAKSIIEKIQNETLREKLIQIIDTKSNLK